MCSICPALLKLRPDEFKSQLLGACHPLSCVHDHGNGDGLMGCHLQLRRVVRPSRSSPAIRSMKPPSCARFLVRVRPPLLASSGCAHPLDALILHTGQTSRVEVHFQHDPRFDCVSWTKKEPRRPLERGHVVGHVVMKMVNATEAYSEPSRPATLPSSISIPRQDSNKSAAASTPFSPANKSMAASTPFSPSTAPSGASTPFTPYAVPHASSFSLAMCNGS